tara:strand:+ start:29 stop:289 length:261 start_codon:yes stop_codon:yes gene_type:complete
MNSDNKFGECCKCPAKMDDSRLFTNYLPNSKLNSYVKKVNGITDDNMYRLFLQENGEKIMENERKFLDENKRCNFQPFEPLPKKKQ